MQDIKRYWMRLGLNNINLRGTMSILQFLLTGKKRGRGNVGTVYMNLKMTCLQVRFKNIILKKWMDRSPTSEETDSLGNLCKFIFEQIIEQS